MDNNLAMMDYAKCTHCETCVLLCPQRTIKDMLDPSKEQAERIKLPKKEAPEAASAERQETEAVNLRNTEAEARYGGLTVVRLFLCFQVFYFIIIPELPGEKFADLFRP